MKKNKENLEKLIKGWTKINPPGLQYFLDVIVPEYYKRMKTISTIDFADRVFSEFVRLTYVRADGMVQCCTCKKRFHRTVIQNGHYKKRSAYKYRFSMDNCHPQCETCNVFLSWNYREYYLFMVDKYGEEKERSIREDNSTKKLLDYDLIEDCVNRHGFIKEKKQRLIDNQSIAEYWINPLQMDQQILI